MSLLRCLLILSGAWLCGVSFADIRIEDRSGQNEAPYEIDGAMTVDTSQAIDLLNEGAVLIDVRMLSDWNSGRIKGAIHLDFREDFFVLYVSDKLDHNAPIIFYCNSPLSYRSAMASFFAVQWGYTNVHYLRDGYYRWLAEDRPVEFDLALNNH